jgi:hypothetical protein
MPLEINKPYHVELQYQWGKKYDVFVCGMISQTSLQEISPNTDLKKEYFDDYSISISNYLRLMPPSVIIYICRPITSHEPYEIDEEDDSRIFIPESLINFVKTYSYLIAKKYTFEVTTGIKEYKNILVENAFFNDIRVRIGESFRNIDDFMADTISTDIKSIDVLVTRNYLDKMKKEQEYLINRYRNALREGQKDYENRQRSLYEQLVRSKMSEENYEKEKNRFIKLSNESENRKLENDHINNVLMRVKSVMVEMIEKLKSGEMQPGDIPPFNQLYSQVEKEMYG